uniref:MarR family winged helix-turn-helix transcriptional regulator n=1 Tax=Paenibacillus sp. FSL K6-1096 TaxID=2921460 RepID=UPI00403F58AC
MENTQWERLAAADHLFRKMVRRFVKERDRVSVEGVALPGMLILHKIIRDGEQRLSDLAEELDFTSGAITALSDKLEAGGYTVRRRKEDDRRTVLLDITACGREMVERNGRASRTRSWSSRAASMSGSSAIWMDSRIRC